MRTTLFTLIDIKMKPLEFRINGIQQHMLEDGLSFGKFLVNLEDNILAFYAIAPLDNIDECECNDVVDHFNLNSETVLGGGEILHADKRLILMGYSEVYGPVPKEVANEFAAILSLHPDLGEYRISGVDVNMNFNQIIQKRYPESIKRWKDLGFYKAIRLDGYKKVV